MELQDFLHPVDVEDYWLELASKIKKKRISLGLIEDTEINVQDEDKVPEGDS